MAEKHTAKRSLVAAWVALLILAGACGGQSVSASEAIPTQEPPTKAMVATPQGPPESPTETLESVDPASSWQQQGSGQRLEIPSCFDFDQGVVSGPPDPASPGASPDRSTSTPSAGPGLRRPVPSPPLLKLIARTRLL